MTFLMIEMWFQVASSEGKLDMWAWEHEFKRLDKHAKKAVSPIIMLGYFRDILKFGRGMDSNLGNDYVKVRLNWDFRIQYDL